MTPPVLLRAIRPSTGCASARPVHSPLTESRWFSKFLEQPIDGECIGRPHHGFGYCVAANNSCFLATLNYLLLNDYKQLGRKRTEF